MSCDDSPLYSQKGTSVEELEMYIMGPFENETEAPDAPDAPLIQPGTCSDEINHIAETQRDNQSSANLFIWILTVTSGVSGLLFGYDTGVISSMLVSINADLSSRFLTTLDKSLITSCTSLFALIASPTAGVLADRLGRKKVILVADALFTLGASWQAITNSVWGMIIGRSIVGLAIGGASLIVPLYISELAPGHLRGRLVTISIMFVTGGQVVAYGVGWLFSGTPAGWRWMVGLGALPSVVQFFFLLFMPETPRWLAKSDCEEDARRVLQKVYRGGQEGATHNAVDHILCGIKREIREEEEKAESHTRADVKGAWLGRGLASLLFHPPHARALTIACMLQGLQQTCGFNVLMYFSATIFSLLRFSSPVLVSQSVACTNFIFTIAAFYLIDRIGRRRILLLSIPVMAVALVLCAVSFSFVPKGVGLKGEDDAAPLDSGNQHRLPALAILISLILYVSTYAIGLGSVPWQQSELFPLSVRSLGSSIATATNWGCNSLVGLTFLPMMEQLTPFWTFATYAIVCALGWLAVWAIYLETMDLELEDVGALLKDGWGVKESLQRVKERRQGKTDIGPS